MTAVFGLLKDVGAYERLQREETELLEKGLAVRAGQNSQVWQTTLTLMDQMVRLSDRQRIPLKHIATRMECGFSAISLAALPPAGRARTPSFAEIRCGRWQVPISEVGAATRRSCA